MIRFFDDLFYLILSGGHYGVFNKTGLSIPRFKEGGI